MPAVSMSLVRRLSRGAVALLTLASVAAAIAADAGPPVADPVELLDLVRDTVLAVDAGNKSGSYETLYAMGSVEFQSAHPVEKLAVEFAKLRATGLDLAPVRNMVPQTTRSPRLDRNGLLRILGYFELPPKQVVYDVVYSYDTGGKRWRLSGILVEPRDLPTQPELMQPQ